MKSNYRKIRRRIKHGKIRSSSSSGNSSMNTNDTNEQLSLIPGSMAYQEYVAEKNKAIVETVVQNDQEMQIESPEKEVDVPDSTESLELQQQKEKFRAAYLRANSIGHNTNLRRRKRSQLKKAKSIIEDGIGKHVSKRDFDDEIFDNGIMADDFIKEAVKDHKDEFENLCEPKSDTNNDGKIDDDDIIMTPGMRRMSRYL